MDQKNAWFFVIGSSKMLGLNLNYTLVINVVLDISQIKMN